MSAAGLLHIMWESLRYLKNTLKEVGGSSCFITWEIDQSRPAIKGAPLERLEQDALWRQGLILPESFCPNEDGYYWKEIRIHPLGSQFFTTTHKEMTQEQHLAFKHQLLLRICITDAGELWLEEYEVTPCHRPREEDDYSYVVSDSRFVHLSEYTMDESVQKILEKIIRRFITPLLLGMRNLIVKEHDFHVNAARSAMLGLRKYDDILYGIEHLWPSASSLHT